MRATCTFQAVRPHTLGLIGLGAIGGSIARQVKQPGNGAAGGIAVVGWSPEPAERALAAQQGALDDAPPRAADVARVADILVLAAPPAANLAQLDALIPHLKSGAFVTDVGSVKRGIVARADRLGISNRFAGSHPLAGTHRHGFEAARADLFRGAVVYVTPCSGPGGGDAAREIVHFWENVLGAEPVVLDAARHDAQPADVGCRVHRDRSRGGLRPVECEDSGSGVEQPWTAGTVRIAAGGRIRAAARRAAANRGQQKSRNHR